MSSMEEDFMQMNSDGYDEQYQKCFRGNSKIYDGVASEFEMPGKLPKTNLNIPIPSAKPSKIGNGDKMCDTCNKEDVCMYKVDLAQAVKEITQISERTNVFIDTDIRCQKWSEKSNSHREKYSLCPKAYGDNIPRCVMLKCGKFCTGKVCV